MKLVTWKAGVQIYIHISTHLYAPVQQHMIKLAIRVANFSKWLMKTIL